MHGDLSRTRTARIAANILIPKTNRYNKMTMSQNVITNFNSDKVYYRYELPCLDDDLFAINH